MFMPPLVVKKLKFQFSYLHKSQYYETYTLPSKSLDPTPILLHTERVQPCLDMVAENKTENNLNLFFEF